MLSGLRKWLLLRLPPCNEVVELVSKSLDTKLTMKELVTVRLHFIVCSWCARYAKQLLLIRNTIREKPEQPKSKESGYPHPLSPEAKQRLKQALRDN